MRWPLHAVWDCRLSLKAPSLRRGWPPPIHRNAGRTSAAALASTTGTACRSPSGETAPCAKPVSAAHAASNASRAATVVDENIENTVLATKIYLSVLTIDFIPVKEGPYDICLDGEFLAGLKVTPTLATHPAACRLKKFV